MKLLFIGLLITIIILLLLNISLRETFQTQPKIQFLNTQIPVNYIKSFNKNDLEARDLHNHNDAITTYNNSIHNPTINQKNIVKLIITSLLQNIPKHKKKDFMYSGWNIVLFKNIENNFPHTHNDVIYFPINKLNNSLYTQNTFLHERIHTLQKRAPALFKHLYEDFWYCKQQTIDISPLESSLRANPDTPNLNWVFKNRYVFLVSYKPLVNNLNSVVYNAYDLKKKKLIELKKCKAFTDFFGDGGINYYHIDEISATMLADYCLGTKQNTKAFKQLVIWYHSGVL